MTSAIICLKRKQTRDKECAGMGRLDGKVALVTAAGRGHGEAGLRAQLPDSAGQGDDRHGRAGQRSGAQEAQICRN